jgi:hypothetical protein
MSQSMAKENFRLMSGMHGGFLGEFSKKGAKN